MNEINIYDEIEKAFVRFVNTLREGLEPALVSIQDMIDGLEQHQAMFIDDKESDNNDD